MEQEPNPHAAQQQFQMLVPDQNQNEAAFLPHFSSFVLNHNHNAPTEEQPLIMDFVIEQETYLILDSICKDQTCSQAAWASFLHRKKEENSRYQYGKKAVFSRISYKERNTIIGIAAQDLQRRKQLWSIGEAGMGKEVCQNAQQELFQQVAAVLPSNELQALASGVAKVKKILKCIFKEGVQKDAEKQASSFWLQHLQILQQNEAALIKWVQDTLYSCALTFKKIRYCKGLEYLCLGIILSYPELSFQKYSQLFSHFLSNNEFEELYLEGSPRFYCQLRKITESLKQQNSLIHDRIVEMKGDAKNLFITYYRSCLLYRLKDLQLIRKLFELLFVEGIGVIKTLILRIMDKMKIQLLTTHNFLQNTASFLIAKYFQQGYGNADYLTKKLKAIFQM